MTTEINSEPHSQPRPGSRAAAKAHSRSKLLKSAKQLFMQHGYEGATMRDIAAAAGLSTGAVFASFKDKADLFNAVLEADTLHQVGLMREIAAKPGSIDERLLHMLSSGYDFHLKQLPLLLAGLSLSWSQGLNGPLADRPVRQELTQLLEQMVLQAIERGELKAKADAALIVETIWDAYVGGYRYAAFVDWGRDALSARLQAKIELVLAGQRRA